jgi:hypothetical protein
MARWRACFLDVRGASPAREVSWGHAVPFPMVMFALIPYGFRASVAEASGA